MRDKSIIEQKIDNAFIELNEAIEELEEENKRLREEVDWLKSMFSTLPQEHFEKFISILGSKDE